MWNRARLAVWTLGLLGVNFAAAANLPARHSDLRSVFVLFAFGFWMVAALVGVAVWWSHIPEPTTPESISARLLRWAAWTFLSMNVAFMALTVVLSNFGNSAARDAA